DVAGSSVQEGDYASESSSITALPRFDDSYASLAAFFEAHNEMVWEYDDSVDRMLHVETDCVPSDR
ncbi:MAG: hypothetical protein HYW02_08275, partial [Deltaproteobacteria bacterium]|nr:hypothetical protein [Deltaproteobacteria bacterium]